MPEENKIYATHAGYEVIDQDLDEKAGRKKVAPVSSPEENTNALDRNE